MLNRNKQQVLLAIESTHSSSTTRSSIPGELVILKCSSQQEAKKWQGMVELHLLVAESQGEEHTTEEVASGDGRNHPPQSKPQAYAVVLEVAVVNEQQAWSKEEQETHT